MKNNSFKGEKKRKKKSTFSCHQIAKQKLNTLWIFFAKLGGLRVCSAGSVPFKSSPRFEAACPFQLTKQAFGGEGRGEKMDDCPSLARPCRLGEGQSSASAVPRLPLSSQSSWRRQRCAAVWLGCRWRVSVCVPNQI